MNVRLLAVLLLALPFTLHGGEGVLIYKGNLWQKDEFARTTPYKAIDKFPTVHNITNHKGEKTRISSDLVLKDFPFPSEKELANLRDEETVKALEARIAEWQAALRRFPSSVKYLKPQIAAIQEEVAHFRSGKVKADGVWMTREKLEEKKRQLAIEREKLMEKLAKEAREMEINTAEWQALDDAGRAKAREARRAAMAAQIAANEERRVAAEIQRQAAIAAARAKLPPHERIMTDETILPPKLSEEAKAEYRKTLEALNTALKPVHHEFAFKREEQKFAIRTPQLIHVVEPDALSPEVTVIRPEEGIDDPPTVELATKDRREVILSYGKEDTKPRRSGMIVLPATSEMDLDEIRGLLSKLITVASVKTEPVAEKAPEKAPRKAEGPGTAETPEPKAPTGAPASP